MSPPDVQPESRDPLRSFLDELRRRRVAKAAVVYAVIAWAIIEASSVIFPALHLPEWTVTFVVLIALISFPVMLIFAWVFDLTREGVVRTPARDALPPERAQALRRGRLVDFLIIAVLSGLVVWLAREKMFGQADVDIDAGLDSIAVLPFVNMSADAENEYFGDGLAEELLNALVGVSGLRVAARTSSFEYKGQNLDVRRIAAALGVDNVLEGSVRRAGDRIRVTAQLIRAGDGFHLWSETYDRPMADIFELQDEIALAIVDALRIRLGGGEARKLTARHTQDVVAFEAYLRGRHAMHQRTPDSLNRALEDFRAAIGRDPDYAAAFSGLSDTYLLLSGYGGLDSAEARRLAEPMARRALDLDPDLAEAQASWGLLLRDRGDYEASLAPLRRAIELNPSYSPAYHWLGLSYQNLGRYNEANVVLRRTLEIDPQYLIGKRVLLGNLRNMGADEEAERISHELERDLPNDVNTLKGLMWDTLMRDPGRSVRLALRVLRLVPEDVEARNAISIILGNLGDIDGARRQMEIAARHDPEHFAVRLAPIRFASLEGDMQAVPGMVDAFLPTVADPVLRGQLACEVSSGGVLPELAIRHCGALLEAQGWTRGAPLPQQSSQVGIALLIAAFQTGDVELVAALEPAVEAELTRLESTGHSPFGLRLGRAQIELYRGNAEPILDLLPNAARVQMINLDPLLQSDPVVAALADEPRFIEAMNIIELRRAEIRAALLTMDLLVD
ncbi:MAG TPA: tetratricopeptide repeat protein [Xanthomonadaceae bacterium]|nr:tetratricopeptide repeat protein [Xanthomonadaceae bacterium]